MKGERKLLSVFRDGDGKEPKASRYLRHLQKGGAEKDAGTAQNSRQEGEMHSRASVTSLQSPFMMIDLLFLKTRRCLWCVTAGECWID